MKNAKKMAVAAAAATIALMFSFSIAIQQEMASAQMTIDELWCATCDVEQESSEEVQGEQTTQRFDGSEDVTTMDEFIADVNAEREFDEQRLAEEQEENGIPDAQNMLSARVVSDDSKAILLNQTFDKLQNNIPEIEQAAPHIEQVEEELDSDEAVRRQIISYEFNIDTIVNDDIRIYTTLNETVQSLARTFTTFTNETNIELYSNGRMIITYDGESSFDERDETRIYAPHEYTIVNGYMYSNGTIYDENNVEIFADSLARTTT
jgi:hypothetical protein